MFKIITNKSWLFALLILLILPGCRLMLIGAYDQVTDQGIQKIQIEVFTIVVKMERNFDNRTPEGNKYENFKTNYESIAAQIETLIIRCSYLPKYQIISEQVKLLGDNIITLEKLNKIGFKTKEELTPVKSGFAIQFGTMIKLQNALKRQK